MKLITFTIILLFLTNCSTHTVKLGKRCTKLAADNTYEKSSEPVIEYYKKLNLLKVIDGERSIDQINNEISDIIGFI